MIVVLTLNSTFLQSPIISDAHLPSSSKPSGNPTATKCPQCCRSAASDIAAFTEAPTFRPTASVICIRSKSSPALHPCFNVCCFPPSAGRAACLIQRPQRQTATFASHPPRARDCHHETEPVDCAAGKSSTCGFVFAPGSVLEGGF